MPGVHALLTADALCVLMNLLVSGREDNLTVYSSPTILCSL